MINGIRIFLIALSSTLIAAITIILIPFDFKGRTTYFCYRLFGRIVLLLCGVKVIKDYRGRLEEGRDYIFVANHLSYLDIPVLMCTLPRNIRFIYKKSLSWIPVFGWSMYLGNYIPIDRKNARSAIESLKKASSKLGKGLSIVIFPEGTRSRDGRTAPFKKGIFMLAALAEADIVPVTVSGTDRILPPDSLKIKGGSVKIIMDNPVAYTKDRNILEEVRNIITGNLKN